MIIPFYFGVITKGDGVARIAAPENLHVEVSGSNYEVTYDAVAGAASYEFRLIGDFVGSWENVGNVLDFTQSADNGTYAVQVRAIDGSDISGHIATSDEFVIGGVGPIVPVGSTNIRNPVNQALFTRPVAAGYTTTGDFQEYQREAAVDVLRISNGGVLLEDSPTPCNLAVPDHVVVTPGTEQVDATWDAIPITTSLLRYEYRFNNTGSWISNGTSTVFFGATLAGGTGQTMNIRSVSTSGVAGEEGETAPFDVASAPLPTPDLLWWKFNEGSGTAIHADVGPDATAAFSSGWTASTQSGSGFAKDAFVSLFTEQIRANSNVTYGTNLVTLSLWAKPNSFILGARFFRSAWGNAQFSFELASRTTSGDLVFVMNDFGNGSVSHHTAPSAIPLSAWSNLVVVFDNSVTDGGGTSKLYINGVLATLIGPDLVGTKANSNFTPETPFLSSLANGAMDYIVDDVRVWSGELNSTQIATLFAAGAA